MDTDEHGFDFVTLPALRSPRLVHQHQAANSRARMERAGLNAETVYRDQIACGAPSLHSDKVDAFWSRYSFARINGHRKAVQMAMEANPKPAKPRRRKSPNTQSIFEACPQYLTYPNERLLESALTLEIWTYQLRECVSKRLLSLTLNAKFN
jgi:hypothetical protein